MQWKIEIDYYNNIKLNSLYTENKNDVESTNFFAKNIKIVDSKACTTTEFMSNFTNSTVYIFQSFLYFWPKMLLIQ